jgi:hypothetical protein
MRRPRPATTLAALLLALTAWGAPEEGRAQSPSPKNPALIDAVTSNPSVAPKLTAEEVAASTPDSAAQIVGEVVGALPSGRRLSLAPRVVSAAIAALPAPQRAPQAPAVACAAIRAVPAAEQSAVVPAIVASAAAMAPTASPLIVACAIQAVPELAAAIIAAAALPPVQPEVIAPSTSPQPGSTIGRDIVAQPPQQQACASPPCP